MAGPAADLTPTFEIPPGYVPGPEMDNFTQVETDEKYSFLVPRVTYGGCSMLNKVIYDPHHTHIGLIRPGSAPAGTRPPTHIYTPLGNIQENLSSEQAAKRHHSKENRAASVQKACEKRSHEDMTLVLHKNKANMTAASKQKRSRVPKKQVQCQTCGQRKHSDRFTRAGWKSHVFARYV